MKKIVICGKFRLLIGQRPLIMGVLNITPDSFSDGGRFLNPRTAVAHALRLEEEGADLIDLGGESTRPGAKLVPVKEEMSRVMPVVERLVGRLKIPISIDTYKSQIAAAACQAGAALINDVTALRDPQMAQVIARAKTAVILMHMRGTPATMQKRTGYRNLIATVRADLSRSIRSAKAAGIPGNKILIDPGIGFGKGLDENLALIRNIGAFKSLGYPVVVGPSRKSFIGLLTGSSIEDRLFGTAAAVALAAAYGADILRVHDVAAMRQVALVAAAIAGDN